MAYGYGGSDVVKIPVAPKCPKCGRDMEHCIDGPPLFKKYHLCRYCNVRINC